VVKKAYKRLKNWRAVGAEMGITGGMAYRIAVDGHEPKEAKIRLQLGLPAMGAAPVCELCGEVHVTARCTKVKAVRHYRDLWDMPVGELRKRLSGREDVI